MQVEKKTRPETGGGAVTEYSDYDGDYSEDASDVKRYYSNEINRSRWASKDGHDPNATQTKKMRDSVDRNRVRRNDSDLPGQLSKYLGRTPSGKELKADADTQNKLAVAINNHYRRKS